MALRRCWASCATDSTLLRPGPDDHDAEPDDCLLLRGEPDDRQRAARPAEPGARESRSARRSCSSLESDEHGPGTKSMLSPRTRLVWQARCAQLRVPFEKYGHAQAVAILREGQAHPHQRLRNDPELRFGDALLLLRPAREAAAVIADDPDFLVLTAKAARKPPRTEKRRPLAAVDHARGSAGHGAARLGADLRLPLSVGATTMVLFALPDDGRGLSLLSSLALDLPDRRACSLWAFALQTDRAAAFLIADHVVATMPVHVRTRGRIIAESLRR